MSASQAAAEIACVAWAWVQVVVAAVAVRRARLAHRPPQRDEGDVATRSERRDRAILVRPVAGDEPDLAERLAVRAGIARVVVAIGAATDSAYGPARDAIGRLGAGASLVETRPAGPNRKAGQLAVVTGDATAGDTIVVADSDVTLADDDVDALLALLEGDPRLGAAWTAVTFAPRPPLDRATPGDRATTAILVGSLHAFPILAGLDRGLFVGKLFAVRANALAAAGGFAAHTTCLGEDVGLASALVGAGYGVARTPNVARATRAGASVREVVDRMTRWILVVKGQRPWLLATYPLVLAGVLPLALLVVLDALVARGTIGPWCALGAATLARVAVALEGRRVVGAARGPVVALVDVALADTVLAVAFVRALTSRAFAWRGVRLHLRGERLTLQSPE